MPADGTAGRPSCSFYAVFDGHGGPKASNCASKELWKKFLQPALLALEAPGRISARNVIRGRVTECELVGTDAFVHLQAGPAEAGERVVARVTASAASALDLRAGREVHAVIKAWALRRLA